MTKLVGITGGIGSGKTTFSNHLKKLGYVVHESDAVVSEIYNNPKKHFLSFIKEKISQNVTNHNKINKTEIANVIFNNNKIKKLLENSKKTLDQEYETSAKIIKDKLESAKKKTLDKI